MTHVENGASFLERRDDTTDNMTAHGGEILNVMHASALDSHPQSTQITIDNHNRTTDDVGAEHVSLNVDEISPEDNRSTHHDWHHRTPQVCDFCSSAQLSCSLNVPSLCLPYAISSIRSRTFATCALAAPHYYFDGRTVATHERSFFFQFTTTLRCMALA